MVTTPPNCAPSAKAPAITEERAATRCISSAELMQGGRELIIAHEGEHYRLQQTRNGKLILIK